MRIFTLFSLLLLPIVTAVAQPNINFETGGAGANYTWTVFENDTPPLEVLANPNATGINTSATVAKMRVLQTNASYAGTVTRSFTPFTLSASNSIVKIMVYKNVISDVGIKFEANAASTGEIKVANTKINEWEELTFDFSSKIGEPSSTNIDGLVIFPDFTSTRAGETIAYFDNITFSAGSASPTLPSLPLDFESSSITYSFSDFEGGVVTVIDNPQSNTINTSTKVGKMVKNAGQVYAGSQISLAAPIDFSTNKIFKVKVFMPKVGAKLLLKVENQSNAGINFEKEATGTVANAWEELSFDYSAINTANTYQKIILIFDLGTMGDGGVNFTYLFDDIRLTTGGGPAPTGPTLPLDFESSTINYTFSDFEGAVTTVIDNPQSNTINTSTKVGKMVKNAGQTYAGSLISLAAPIDFSTNKTFKVKVFMPKVGAKLLLKVENQSNSGINFEKEATGTVANAWEELTFDYSAINTANTYEKIILIFDLGTMGDGGANFTYLFDDIRLTTGGGTTPTGPTLPLDFESSTITYTFSDFEGAVTTVIGNPESNSINTSTKVGKMVKNAGQTYAGSLISLGAPIDFSTNKTFKVKVFMPKVGAKLLLKVENLADAGINFEKEATGTVANAWEELTFDYSAINTANTYQKIILIFDLGIMGDGGANFTYLFDDIKLEAAAAGSQTITFPAIPDKTVGDPAFALTATASSNLPVSYSTDSDKVTISGSTVTIVKAGRAVIKANQAGNDSFSAAPEASRSFCIKPAKPTITANGSNAETITLTSSATSGNIWYLNGTAIPSATNTTLSVTAPGIYKVQVTADDCLSAFSTDVTLIVTGDLSKQSDYINAYPNPVVNYLQLTGIKGALSNVQLVDLAGRRNAIEFKKYGEDYQADVQHLTPGVYLLQVQEGAVLHRIKLIKK